MAFKHLAGASPDTVTPSAFCGDQKASQEHLPPKEAHQREWKAAFALSASETWGTS
ncbi:Hypothetical predicted protein [Marmota monax]|uniref:Uncharacterized protein n=1 Tax=Marmota monax TaxID=9995 RepID=A0A5E4C5R7_MARMO|nr:hypothetical protein GHT09_006825 [Marmota monax]VTJ77016.1 Hypothetical predicted protein [Marmota monax]